MASHRHKRPPPGFCSWLSSGRGRRRDDDHDGDHCQDGISSEADAQGARAMWALYLLRLTFLSQIRNERKTHEEF